MAGEVPHNSRNDVLKTGVLIAAIIGAVAGPLLGGLSSLGNRLDNETRVTNERLNRVEARMNVRILDFDTALQNEIAAVDGKIVAGDETSQHRHDDQQIELFRLRDRLDLIPALEAEIEVLKTEVERLRNAR